jgi:hypothetical protein
LPNTVAWNFARVGPTTQCDRPKRASTLDPRREREDFRLLLLDLAFLADPFAR